MLLIVFIIILFLFAAFLVLLHSHDKKYLAGSTKNALRQGLKHEIEDEKNKFKKNQEHFEQLLNEARSKKSDTQIQS